MNIPLLADKNLEIARSYGVLKEDGVAFRGLFVIDDKQNLRQVSSLRYYSFLNDALGCTHIVQLN